MKKLWQKVRRAFQDSMRQQVTRLGLAFTVLVIVVGFAAFASANNLLFLLLAALLSTLLISGFVSRLGLAGLELNMEVPEHVAAQRKVPARLLVKNTKWLVPSFSLQLSGSPASGLPYELYLPLVPSGKTLEAPIELFFQKRGLYQDNTFWFASRFPFGFTFRKAEVVLEQEILVYPSIDPLPGLESLLDELAGEVEAKQRGRGTDFYRIRPYVGSDSARHVDWKASAHTGNLQVREFARDEDQPIAIFLDLNVSPEMSAWFEHAVQCCAFFVWRFHDQGTKVRLVTQNFDRTIGLNADVYDFLRYLARVETRRGPSPQSPNANELTIAITPQRGAVEKSGWDRGQVFTPEDLG